MKSICIIPARYASSRLPGKPLALIDGKPMIRWVYEQAVKADKIDAVLVATDDIRIKEAVESFGGAAVLTASHLPSGTDRVAAAAENTQADVIINLQGDEPLIAPRLLTQLVEVFSDPRIQIATAVKKITVFEELMNPNVVHVVRNKENFALYFSRSAIPFLRDVPETALWPAHHGYFKHVGIYAYRKDVLLKLRDLPQSPLEKAERLEQLRFLENGFTIYTVETSYESMSVDTMEDLQQVNKIIKEPVTTQKR